MASTDVEIRIRAVDQYSRTMKEAGRAIKGLEQSGGKGAAAAAAGRSGGIFGAADRGGSGGVGGRSGIAMPLGLSPGMIGAAGLGLGVKEVINDAADFESALTAIQKKAGITAEQTKRVGEEALALATSGEIASSIDEIIGEVYGK